MYRPSRRTDRGSGTRTRRAIALSLSVLALAFAAHADDKGEAEKQFRAGVSLQKVEDFDAAIAAFQTSLRLFPTKGALFNLGNCLRAAHRYDEAFDALERLLQDYGAELDESMRSAAEAQLQELRNLSATLEVQVDQPGAEVWIDGRLVGRTPLSRAIRMSPGEHDVEVRLPGFEPASERIDLQARQLATRQVRLTPVSPPPAISSAPSPKPAPAPPPKSPPPMQETRTGALATTGWISAGTGAAFLAAGAFTGIWALRLDRDLNDACVGGHCSVGRSDDVDRLNTLTTSTNVLLGVGVTLTAAGVVMVLSDPSRAQDQAERVPVGVSVGPGMMGATVWQRF